MNLQLFVFRANGITDEELEGFLKYCKPRTFRRKELLSQPGQVANDVFFIQSGVIKGAMSVVIEVTVIDSARLARAR